MKPTILHLISHPIQYQVPLYERLAADTDIQFKVLYCSKAGLENSHDKEFGVNVSWDIPMLNNYKYQFLKNYARPETLDNFLGLSNFGIIRELMSAPRNSIVWIHGWNYMTHVLCLFVGRLLGHQVFLRGENTAIIENQNPKGLKKTLKNIWLGNVLFKVASKVLSIGNQNRAFFRQMNVAENDIVFTPYCIDNQRFTTFYQNNKANKLAIRQNLNLPTDKRILVFSGKYIDKKRPMDLLRALALLKPETNVFAVLVGEGNLRGEMEAFIQQNNLVDRVRLTGFVNQSEIPNYYLAADAYIMCSGVGETWGLSTNEALCFGLPVVLSDFVGCSSDLVDGNGFVFPCGDVVALANSIEKLFALPLIEFRLMQMRSLAIIQNYSYDKIIDNLKALTK